MEGTPKAKARRQSLPSQHFLSSPQAANDDPHSHAHAELVRFRDEMGIDSQTQAYFAQSYHSLGNQATTSGGISSTSQGIKVSRGASKNSPASNGHIKSEDQSGVHVDGQNGGAMLLSGENGAKKKIRKKWTIEETKMLVEGCNKHGVGNWKSMLDDPDLTFDPDRTPVDLKDRFRTYFPEAYRHLYPNAKTHLSNGNSNRNRRAELPDSLAIFEKSRSKKRRPFTKEEDDALREGFEKHGTVWAVIAKNPALASRRSTDLRDRFRNAFPDLYEKAGYKPRPSRPMKKRREEEAETRATLPVASTSSAQSHGREGSEGHDSKHDVRPRSQPTIATPEEDHSFEDSGCIVDDGRMDTDQENDNLRPSMVPIPSSSSDGSVVPSRQRSPSNARNPNASQNEGEGYLSPGDANHAHLRQSPAHHSHPHAPLQHPHPAFDTSRFGEAWYPARWLQGATMGMGHEGEPSPSHHAHNITQQHPVPMLMTDFSSQGMGLSANNLGMLGLGLGGFGLSAGGWSNQQTIIDRYDLPTTSQQLLGNEFHSEAGIGDTGSSLSGLDDFETSLSLSSHHRYAGDLFHGRGAGYGGSGWGGFGFVLGGGGQEGMPSFARAGMDLGAPGSHAPNGIRTPNTNPNALGMPPGSMVGNMMPPLDLGSASHSPEHGQAFRSELSLESIEELEHVLGNSVLASPTSVDPSKTILHDISTPPPGTPAPNSPPLMGRNFGAVDPRANLVRHGSMGGEVMGHNGRMHGQQYQQNHHQHHSQGGGSHSRSFSQPPSETRMPMSSPMKHPYQLEGGYGPMGYDGQQANASPAHQHHSMTDHFSPAGTPNQGLQNLDGRSSQSPQHHQVHLQHSHHQHQHQHQHQHPHHDHHQQRTPVQSHAQLQTFNTLYPPTASLLQVNNPSAWNQLSTAAMALDLHGFQYPAGGHAHPHLAGQQHGAGSGLGLVTNGLPAGGSGAYAAGNHFMDQYLDFETNALDLATAVAPPSGGGSFASGPNFTLNSPEPQNQSTNSAPSRTQTHPQMQHAQHNQAPSNPSPHRPSFQLSAPTPASNPNPNQTSNMPHIPAHNSFGPPAMTMGSLDDSILIHQAHHANPGGMHRRESFSFGTNNSPMHNVSTPVFHPLNRVHSAGANAGVNNTIMASPSSISHTSTTSSSKSGSSHANQSLKSKGWDKTITSKSAKRSSWGPLRSFANGH